MSTISHKKPGFGALNTRKPDPTVGQNYGERLERTKASEVKNPLSWIQRTKDLFSGSKKQNNIKDFANKEDRFLGSTKTYFSHNPIVEKKSRLEEGLNIQSRVVQPAPDQYVRFLDSVIHYIDVSKTKKKV